MDGDCAATYATSARECFDPASTSGKAPANVQWPEARGSMLRLFKTRFSLVAFTHELTFPMTISRQIARALAEVERRTYVTCLHCGEEIAYNWDTMQTEGAFHAAARAPFDNRGLRSCAKALLFHSHLTGAHQT